MQHGPRPLQKLKHAPSGAASKAWSQSGKQQRSQRASIEARWRQLDLSALKVTRLGRYSAGLTGLGTEST